MNARGLIQELLATGAVTVVTTRDGAPLGEKTALDAVTTIQLDGDVVTYIREDAPLDRHFAALRQVRGRLRRFALCWRFASRGAFWGALAAAQYPAQSWALEASLRGGAAALGAAMLQPEHWLRSAGGVFAWFGLRAVEALGKRAIRRALSGRSAPVFSGRVAHVRV
ncbi:MAG TPA: hypothetical protein VFQ35_17885 [Polyangiaceae bacterium]|nr:hypothetical protein [Polyangiaceae bacterium]